MMVWNVLFYFLLAAVSTGIVWKGSSILEESSDHLASFYDLPPIVQGAMIAAIGSSFPELSTTVLSTLLHGEFELGVASIVGSAVFNILVIPALATLIGSGAMEANRDLVYKEAQFYMIAVGSLLMTFSLAVIYLPAEGADILGYMTRPLAILPILLYMLYVFVQYEDTMDYEKTEETDISPWKQWSLLVLSLGIVVAGVEGLVRSAIGLGEVLGTPSFVWGLTMISVATSLPDAFVSIKASVEGKASTSMANVLGSNIFDLLVAVPAGILIAGATVINFSRAAPMMGFLILATIVLFVSMRTDMETTNTEAWVFLGLYVVFVALVLLDSFGVLSGVL